MSRASPGILVAANELVDRRANLPKKARPTRTIRTINERQISNELHAP